MKELTSITEKKLRELEQLCFDYNKELIENNVTVYYNTSKKFVDNDYDARHHVAVSFAYLTRIKKSKELKGG